MVEQKINSSKSAQYLDIMHYKTLTHNVLVLMRRNFCKISKTFFKQK